jgi:transcriptional regulator with XRE-family HTH domain
VDDLPTRLSDNLKRLRQARQLSQRSLAGLSGVPRPTLAHLESGTANPTLSLVLRVAGALGVTLDELLAQPSNAIEVTRKRGLPTQSGRKTKTYSLYGLRSDALRWERIELQGGAQIALGEATGGMQRQLSCEQGDLELAVSGERVPLGAGDKATLRVTEKATALNRGSQLAVVHVLCAPPV